MLDEMQRIERLAVSSSVWEVGILRAPLAFEGVDIEGMLFVVEQQSGDLRGGGPIVRGDPLWSLLAPAFLEPPAPCVAGRPRRILCSDEEVRRRLAAELRGLDLDIRVGQQLSALDRVVDAFAELNPAGARGIEADPEGWCAALEVLCAQEPWRLVPDSVTFRFEGGPPELAEAVAVLLGRAGQQEGLVLYPSAAAWERFAALALAPAASGLQPLEHVAALCVFFEPAADALPDELEACREAGLVLPGERLPLALALRYGEGDALSPREQQVLLAAVEAVTAMCLLDLGHLATESRRRSVRTSLGPLTVASRPAAHALLGPALPDAEHAIVLGVMELDDERVPTVIVKMHKRNALRLARRVVGADAIEVRSFDGFTSLHLWRDDAELGLLAVSDMDRFSALADAENLLVCVSAGGPRRRRIDPDEFVHACRLPVRRADLHRRR